MPLAATPTVIPVAADTAPYTERHWVRVGSTSYRTSAQPCGYVLVDKRQRGAVVHLSYVTRTGSSAYVLFFETHDKYGLRESVASRHDGTPDEVSAALEQWRDQRISSL